MQAKRSRSALRVVPTACVVALSFGLLVTACGKAPGPPSEPPRPPLPTAGVAPGLVDDRLWANLPAGSPGTLAAIHEDTHELHAAWLRLDILWADFEPAPGRHDRARLARLDELVAAIHAAGGHILLTVRDVPVWASDPSWWKRPPKGIAPGYHSYYPMKQAALTQLGEFAELLARRYAGRVQALECWNEPNFWWFLYPQQTLGDADFGARTYLRMLEAFSAGVRRAHTGVQIVAGGTASIGNNDTLGTSPLRFAGYLARHGAASLFDVYSLHAYTPGASVHRAPGAVPDHPATTVTLGNLPTLLRLFPGKPFYVTEYGYNTQPSSAFGWFTVSEAKQASYLQRAFTVAARYPQVKLLIWFLVVDEGPRPGAPADSGVYTGLRRVDGARKPSWYAFARVGRAYARVPAQARK